MAEVLRGNLTNLTKKMEILIEDGAVEKLTLLFYVYSYASFGTQGLTAVKTASLLFC